MAIAVLEDMGQFIQETLSTNTPRVLINQFVNIYNRHETRRSVGSAAAILVVGGLGVPIFLGVPEIHNYVGPIVHQFLPFVSEIGEKIGVGFVGFWITGAVGFNAAEFVHRVVSSQEKSKESTEDERTQKKSFEDLEDKISDEKIEEIIDANPHMYSRLDDSVEKIEYIVQLKEKLKSIRDKIKSDSRGKKRDHLKPILESALEKKDLLPLLVELSENQAKRRAKLEYSQQFLDYLDNQIGDVIEIKNISEYLEKSVHSHIMYLPEEQKKAKKEEVMNAVKHVVQKQQAKLDAFQSIGDEKFRATF